MGWRGGEVATGGERVDGKYERKERDGRGGRCGEIMG